MKKFLSLLIMATILLFCFVSCGDSEEKKSSKENSNASDNGGNDENTNIDYTMSDFIDSLGDDYYINEYSSPEEVQSMASQYQLDPSKYGATMGISARNKTTYCMVIIIECDSASNASTLKIDCAPIVENLKNSYNSKYTFEAKAVGKYVLIGETTAISDAMRIDKDTDSSISNFINNLGDNYFITQYTDPEEIKSMTAQFQLDPSKYGATMGVSARNKTTYCMVVIVECDSTSSASVLKADCASVVEYLESSYDSKYTFDAVLTGKYVLIGEVSAINDALGL